MFYQRVSSILPKVIGLYGDTWASLQIKSVNSAHLTISKCDQDCKTGKRELMRLKSLFMLLQTYVLCIRDIIVMD